jgi:hypothetical protein
MYSIVISLTLAFQRNTTYFFCKVRRRLNNVNQCTFLDETSEEKLYGESFYGKKLSGEELFTEELSMEELSREEFFGEELFREKLFGEELSSA